MINQNLRVMPDLVLAEPYSNRDQQVNHGCNLKWKLGDKRNKLLSVSAVFRGKRIAKPSE